NTFVCYLRATANVVEAAESARQALDQKSRADRHAVEAAANARRAQEEPRGFSCPTCSFHEEQGPVATQKRLEECLHCRLRNEIVRTIDAEFRQPGQRLAGVLVQPFLQQAGPWRRQIRWARS